MTIPIGGASLDFHLDTHYLMSQTDYGKKEEARQESADKESKVIYTDKDHHMHIYDNGVELSSNSRHSSHYDGNDLC